MNMGSVWGVGAVAVLGAGCLCLGGCGAASSVSFSEIGAVAPDQLRTDSAAQDARARPVPTKVHRSSGFGWTEGQDISEAFAMLLQDGTLKAGEELVLEHTYRISGGYTLPDRFTLSAVKGAGFAVTDATVKHKPGPALLELGDGCTLHNLTITYLDTPPLGPTGEKPGVTFSGRLGIRADGKHNLRIENCRLIGSIGHHVRMSNCRKVEFIGCHIAGGHWSVFTDGGSDMVFRRCLIEQCQGDAIKGGGDRVLVEDCAFQDNLRDGIDTAGGLNDAVIRNCTFRRMKVSAMDIKSFYDSPSALKRPKNVGILIERCLFHDMPNGIVLTTMDVQRGKGGEALLTAENMKKYAPHDIELKNCVIGHAEKPLQPKRDGGYGVNYPSDADEHMRAIRIKDGYGVRYRNLRLSGERIRTVYVRSDTETVYARFLSKEAADALGPDQATGNVLDEPVPPIKPGVTEVPFPCGPQQLD